MYPGIIITASVGILFVILGLLVWKKEKITLFHDYHYDKVSEIDKSSFCRLSGQGLTLSGIALLITALLLGITESPLSFIVFAVGFIIGIGMMIYAEKKYNTI